jgi:hypothetical protein
MSVPSINWKRVVEIWRKSGRTPGTIALYTYLARRFVNHCSAHGKSPVASLRRREVERVIACGKSRYGRRGWGGGRSGLAATRALSCAMVALGPRARVGRPGVFTTLGSGAARVRRAPRALPRGSGIDDPRGGRVCNVLHRVSAQQRASRCGCPPRRRGRIHLEMRGAMDAQNGRRRLQCVEGISTLPECKRPTTLRPCVLRVSSCTSDLLTRAKARTTRPDEGGLASKPRRPRA